MGSARRENGEKSVIAKATTTGASLRRCAIT
jgi:hypothetical protein